MKTNLLLPAAALALALAACTGGTGEKAAQTAAPSDSLDESTPADRAGWYAGTLPCADCPGIFTQLDLRADSTYLLRRRYLERDSIPYGEIGQWTVQGGVLLLKTSGEPGRWRMGGDSLHMLDAEGRDVPGPMSNALSRVAAPAPSAMHLAGGYAYYADAHSFTPNGSRYALPVAADGAATELGRRYGRQVKTPPDPMPVRIIARLEDGPAMEGNGTEQYVHVLRVEE